MLKEFLSLDKVVVMHEICMTFPISYKSKTKNYDETQ